MSDALSALQTLLHAVDEEVTRMKIRFGKSNYIILTRKKPGEMTHVWNNRDVVEIVPGWWRYTY